MPTYEYECKKCGHFFEKYQSMNDKLLQTCPVCRKKSLQRLIGMGAGVIFKGSGFYETDYRSSSYSKEAKKEKETVLTSSPSKTSDDTSSKSTTKDKKEN